jgi:hypothetical protein
MYTIDGLIWTDRDYEQSREKAVDCVDVMVENVLDDCGKISTGDVRRVARKAIDSFFRDLMKASSSWPPYPAATSRSAT